MKWRTIFMELMFYCSTFHGLNSRTCNALMKAYIRKQLRDLNNSKEQSLCPSTSLCTTKIKSRQKTTHVLLWTSQRTIVPYSFAWYGFGFKKTAARRRDNARCTTGFTWTVQPRDRIMLSSGKFPNNYELTKQDVLIAKMVQWMQWLLNFIRFTCCMSANVGYIFNRPKNKPVKRFAFDVKYFLCIVFQLLPQVTIYLFR